KFLPPLISGDLRMAICISEADAGSDVGAMRTTARQDGDVWRVDGHKLWCTGAGVRDTLLNVYLKTDPSVSHTKGMSLFLIDNDAPGVHLKKLDMLGRGATGTYEILFDDVPVTPDRIVG